MTILGESIDKRPMEFEVDLKKDFDSANGARVSNKTSKIGYNGIETKARFTGTANLGQSDHTINHLKNQEKVSEEPEKELQEDSDTEEGEDFIIGESLDMNQIPKIQNISHGESSENKREMLRIDTKIEDLRIKKEKPRKTQTREKANPREERGREKRAGTLQPNYSVYTLKRNNKFGSRSERGHEEAKSVQISSKKRDRRKKNLKSKLRESRHLKSDSQELLAYENLDDSISRRKPRIFNPSKTQRPAGSNVQANFSTLGVNHYGKTKNLNSKLIAGKRLINKSTTKDLFQKLSTENNPSESVPHSKRLRGKNQQPQKDNKDPRHVETLLKRCAQFKHETQNNLFEVETLNNLIRSENNYVAKADYLTTHQKYLDAKVRTVLMGWMGEVCEDLWFSRDTFHLACNYVDRFLSAKKNVTKNNLQLIGLTCLYAASKMEEVQMRCVSDYLASACNIYSEEMLKTCEIEIITVLDFKLNPPTLNMWSNWYMIQWDNFVLGDSFVCEHPLVKDNPVVAQFKQGNDESYNLYREFMQYIGKHYKIAQCWTSRLLSTSSTCWSRRSCILSSGSSITSSRCGKLSLSSQQARSFCLMRTSMLIIICLGTSCGLTSGLS